MHAASRGQCTYPALVSPPVALALDVFARSLAEVGRADDDDLEAPRPGLVASPRTGRDAHRVPLLELDDLVVELHPPAPAQDHVHLLLLPVRVAVRKAIAGRDALVAQTGSLELERLGRQAELKVRRAVEPGSEVLQVLPEIPERERHGRNRMVPCGSRRSVCVESAAPGSFPAALRGPRLGCLTRPGRLQRMARKSTRRGPASRDAAIPLQDWAHEPLATSRWALEGQSGTRCCKVGRCGVWWQTPSQDRGGGVPPTPPPRSATPPP